MPAFAGICLNMAVVVLTLTRLEARIIRVDDIHAAFAANDLARPAAFFEAFKRISDFHGTDILFRGMMYQPGASLVNITLLYERAG